MTYEEKMRAYQEAKNKEEVLQRIMRGDKSVDITKSEDIFHQVNKDRMSIDQFTNRTKFNPIARDIKEFKRDLLDTKFGKTKSGHGRLVGMIPSEIFFARKELSDPNLPKEEKDKNINKFLNEFPVFRTGDARL
jgi:hypothetical protein